MYNEIGDSMLIDTHLHLSTEDFHEDEIKDVLRQARLNHVLKYIVCGCSKSEIKNVIKLYSNSEDIYLALGYHPEFANVINKKSIEILEGLIQRKNVVAVGEIGLDYHYGKENSKRQKIIFIEQLKLAEKYNLPVVIHTREAIEETYEILSKFHVRGVIHCFSGSYEMAEKFIKLGFYLGIGGVITFKNSKLKNVVAKIGLDHIVFETDSPYLAPEPYRGKKNGPQNVYHIASYVADLLNMSLEEVEDITTKNAMTLFDLK